MVVNNGIVRTLDKLGRIVIPKEIRNTFYLKTDDPFEIFLDGDSIILRKYEPFCTFCGDSDGIVLFGSKKVCRNCLKKIQKL